MKYLTTLYLILFLVSTAQAQHEISGQIIDTAKQPVVYANVVLLHTKTNTIYKGTITNETGFFNFKNVNSGLYILKIRFIGYKVFSKKLDVFKTKKLGKIILSDDAQALEEVSITVKKPVVKQLVDRLVFNIENTTLSEGNAWDIIKHTPGVIVHQDQISIRNSTNNIVLINDKRVNLSATELKQLLESTSGNTITAIEVITNPPAKYEAEGASVLNIKMNKNTSLKGYKGAVQTVYTQATFPKWLFSTSQFYKKKGISIYGSYSHNHSKYNRLEHEVINFFSEPKNSYISNLDRISWNKSHNLRLTTAFDINKKQSFTLSSQLYFSPQWRAKNKTESEVLDGNTEKQRGFVTRNKVIANTKNLAFDADYSLKFNNDKHLLTTTFNYTDYTKDNNQNVSTVFYTPENNTENNTLFTTLNLQKTRLYSLKSDYENTLSETQNIQIGLKFSNVNSFSDLAHFNIKKTESTLDTSRSNTFNYNEKNWAGYISYSNDFGAFSLKGGLRVEHTNYSGNAISSNLKTNKNYTKLFPTFYILYPFNSNNEFSFSYGKRITRPQYASLNPFAFYFSDYSFFEGNPNLEPEITNTFDALYTAYKKYNFSLYYTIKKNPINEVNFQDNANNTLRFTNVNLDRDINIGFLFNTSINILPIWTLYTNQQLSYNENTLQALESNTETYTNKTWQYYGYLQNSFSLLKDKSLNAEISYYYITKSIQGSLSIQGSQDLSIGISKKIFKNKGKLSIRVTDLLNTQVIRIATKYSNQDNFFIDNQETQTIRLSFNYSFGNQKLKKKASLKSSEEQKRL